MRARQEEEEKNAEKQREVWKNYIEAELRLLNKADKPFALTNDPPNFNRCHVDVETETKVTKIADDENLQEICERYGYRAKNGKIQMSLKQFKEFSLDKGYSFNGEITLLTTDKCDSHHSARNFGNDKNYRTGRGKEYEYGEYDRIEGKIQLTYRTDSPKKIEEFYGNASSSYHFDSID
mgnify:FL=1